MLSFRPSFLKFSFVFLLCYNPFFGVSFMTIDKPLSEVVPAYYHDNSKVQQGHAKALIDIMEFRGDEKVLDVGAGNGRLTAEIASRVPRGSVLGIDKSEKMVTFAKEVYPQSRNPNLSFERGLAEEAHGEAKYDVVTSFNTLLWVRDKKLALKNMRDALKPGGRIYIQTYQDKALPYGDFLVEALDDLRWADYTPVAAQHTWLTDEEFKDAIAELGLRPVLFESKVLVGHYDDEEALVTYMRGWIQNFVTLPEDLNEAFLQRAAECGRLHSVDQGDSKIHLPFKRILMILEVDDAQS